MYSEEMDDLYSSPDIRRIRWMWHVAHIGDMKTHRILVGKLDGKRPF
jgi:hypothetical protein